jgi:hypothetical protein
MPDPTFDPTGALAKIFANMEKVSDEELDYIGGALVGEYVNRGNDHETALKSVIESAQGGVLGSKLFDQMEG